LRKRQEVDCGHDESGLEGFQREARAGSFGKKNGGKTLIDVGDSVRFQTLTVEEDSKVEKDFSKDAVVNEGERVLEFLARRWGRGVQKGAGTVGVRHRLKNLWVQHTLRSRGKKAVQKNYWDAIS